MSDLQKFLDTALPECSIAKDNDTIYKKLANDIINIRNEMNMTQKELANLCDIQQSNISRLENATYNPSVQLLEKIAKATGKKLVINFS